MKDPNESTIADYLVENLAPLGEDIFAKRMFGGYGIFAGEVMFGLIADGEFYLKVDEESQEAFDARDLPSFTYERNGRVFEMSYRLAPSEALDNPRLLQEWGERGLAAARRQFKPKPQRKRRGRS